MTKKVVLITGSSRGLGLELTRQYAEAGWYVHACARRLSKAVKLKALAQLHENISLHELDITSDRQIRALAGCLQGQAIDLLINNAGVYGPKGLAMDEIDRETWLNVLNVNTVSPLLVSLALLPNLRAGQLKKLVIISSKMGSQADNSSGGSYIYRSGKSAVNAVGKSLSVDLQPDGIAVAVLHPGWVQTDMGGPAALIKADKSVTGMCKVIDQLTLENSGRFVAFDGVELPW
ncbi:MAG: SDR family oxidoreductase [Marinobacterium sp.]|nr:SDR family oxidoreductase [Marinobacterium sp.]